MGRRLTKEEFVDKAMSVHGDKYDYSMTNYKNSRIPVQIGCPTHGIFTQSVAAHHDGKGCSKCSGLYQPNTPEFIEKIKKVHGEKYDYSRIEYTNSKGKVLVGCRAHGDFSISAAMLLSGFGCPYCSGKKINTASFIEKARLVHGSFYEYTEVQCSSVSKKVKILCPDHGEFMQCAASHLRGNKCPSCAKYGFKRTEPANIYCLKSEDGAFMKVGITADMKTRMYHLSLSTPFRFSLVCSKRMSGHDAHDNEQTIHSKFMSAGLSGFQGCTEWMRSDDEIVSLISGMQQAGHSSSSVGIFAT